MKALIMIVTLLFSTVALSQYEDKLQNLKELYFDETFIDCYRLVADGTVIFECEDEYYTIDDSFDIKVVSYVVLYNKNEFAKMKLTESDDSEGFVVICSKNEKLELMAISIAKK